MTISMVPDPDAPDYPEDDEFDPVADTSIEPLRRPNRAMVRDVAMDERWKRALELRKLHFTYEEIGEKLGVGSSTAAVWVRKALKFAVGKAAEDYRSLELVRLDELSKVVWPYAAAGDPEYIRLYLDLMKRRASMLGLDITKSEIKHTGNAPGSQQAIIVVGGDGTKSFIASLEEYNKMSHEKPALMPPAADSEYEEALAEYADEVIDAEEVVAAVEEVIDVGGNDGPTEGVTEEDSQGRVE